MKRAPEQVDAGRRAFLVAASAAGGGLLIGVAGAARAAVLAAAGGTPAAGEGALNPWVRIGTDSTVTIIVSQAEIGQGISTTLPAILADELGADWSRVRLETAPYDKAYQNPRVNWMFTGNSESIQSFHDLMRKTGAAARDMLVRAAANRWGVAPSSCRTENGFVVHAPTRRRLAFGEVAADAARLDPPRAPELRPAGELKLVGRSAGAGRRSRRRSTAVRSSVSTSRCPASSSPRCAPHRRSAAR